MGVAGITGDDTVGADAGDWQGRLIAVIEIAVKIKILSYPDRSEIAAGGSLGSDREKGC
jgi:hypothetical protein